MGPGLNTDQTANFKAEFPKLFTGLGKLKTKYRITLDKDVQPVALFTLRKVPHPLMHKVKDELDALIKTDVISPVTEPTDWCSALVPVLKQSGKVRICVDLQLLNRAVKREVHPMSSVQTSLAKLKNAQVMTKLDANSGFWQIPLDEESRQRLLLHLVDMHLINSHLEFHPLRKYSSALCQAS